MPGTFGTHCGRSQATANTASTYSAGEHEAGDERRGVELGQRLLGDDGVDREQHRGGISTSSVPAVATAPAANAGS